MIYIATFKAIACAPTVGETHQIRVQADSKDEAAKEARFASDFEGCGSYAITKIEEEIHERP